MKNLRTKFVAGLIAVSLFMPLIPYGQEAPEDGEQEGDSNRRRKTTCIINGNQKCQKPGDECDLGSLDPNCGGIGPWVGTVGAALAILGVILDQIGGDDD